MKGRALFLLRPLLDVEEHPGTVQKQRHWPWLGVKICWRSTATGAVPQADAEALRQAGGEVHDANAEAAAAGAGIPAARGR